MNIKINDVTFVSCSVQHDFMATLHLSNHTSYVLIKTFHNFVSAQTVNTVNVCRGGRHHLWFSGKKGQNKGILKNMYFANAKRKKFLCVGNIHILFNIQTTRSRRSKIDQNRGLTGTDWQLFISI